MAEQRKCHSTPHKIPIFFIHAPNIETSHVLVFTFNAIPVHIFIAEMSESLFFISAGVEAEQAWLHVNSMQATCFFSMLVSPNAVNWCFNDLVTFSLLNVIKFYVWFENGLCCWTESVWLAFLSHTKVIWIFLSIYNHHHITNSHWIP